MLLPFIPYVIGVLRYGWGFNELSALFLVAGFAVGLLDGRNLSETAAAFLRAMEGLLAAALFVGVARGISVALSDGRVLDTILYGLAAPLAHVPSAAATDQDQYRSGQPSPRDDLFKAIDEGLERA